MADQQNRAFDISKAKRYLGYRPRVGLQEGLQRTAAWAKENGYIQVRRLRETADPALDRTGFLRRK